MDRRKFALVLFVLGVLIILASGPRITGMVTGGSVSSSGFIFLGIVFIVAAMVVEKSAENLEKRMGFFISKQRDTYMTDPAHIFTSNSHALKVEDVKILAELDENVKHEALAQYGGALNAFRASKEFGVYAEDILRVLDPHYKKRRTKEEFIKGYDPRYQAMMHSDKLVYVHFTNPESADRICKKGQGLLANSQTFIFTDRKAAELFVSSGTQKVIGGMCGASHVEKAIIFETEMMPDDVNSLLNGKPKAIFREAVPYDAMKNVYLQNVSR